MLTFVDVSPGVVHMPFFSFLVLLLLYSLLASKFREFSQISPVILMELTLAGYGGKDFKNIISLLMVFLLSFVPQIKIAFQ